ncbi:hypothetical protein [Azohydromonas aeria]|uniref:hypothetical protein n=1 Tax=Azohydromonas aeria TaxID=2590212 RepID=UPI0012F8281D|nr:hypothetical protein [Azohydromonas aeria]
MSEQLSYAIERYSQYRAVTRRFVEQQALQDYGVDVKVTAVTPVVLQQFRDDWRNYPGRLVDWDWDKAIIKPLEARGPRTYSCAFTVEDKLCGLVAARVSRGKKWLSLTHVEGHPDPSHPLKKHVVPMAIMSLYAFRFAMCSDIPPTAVGIRVLRPLPDALQSYKNAGYSHFVEGRWDSAIIVAAPVEQPNTGETCEQPPIETDECFSSADGGACQ